MLCEFLEKWIVLEPMMFLNTMSFGSYVTQQHMFKDIISDINNNRTEDEIEIIVSHFYRFDRNRMYKYIILPYYLP